MYQPIDKRSTERKTVMAQQFEIIKRYEAKDQRILLRVEAKLIRLENANRRADAMCYAVWRKRRSREAAISKNPCIRIDRVAKYAKLS